MKGINKNKLVFMESDRSRVPSQVQGLLAILQII